MKYFEKELYFGYGSLFLSLMLLTWFVASYPGADIKVLVTGALFMLFPGFLFAFGCMSIVSGRRSKNLDLEGIDWIG